MTDRERRATFRTLPARRTHAWRLASSSYHDTYQWRLSVLARNEGPYNLPSMQRHDWVIVSMSLPVGILMGYPWPHCMFALVEKDPDIVILLDGSDELEKLTYYLKQRERLHKRHHVRVIETALDYHFEVPDAGYSYCWEDGSLIKGSYMDRILHHSGEHTE